MKRAQRPADLEREEEALFLRLAAAGAACPDPARLQAALADALPEADGQELRRHLEGCPACRALAAGQEEAGGAPLSPHEEERLWRRVREGTAAPVAAPRRWLWAAAAALFAAAVPATLLLRGSVQPSPSPLSPTSPSAGAPVLPLEKLDVLTPPGAALVWRDGGSPAERALHEALARYAKGDLAEAAAQLQGVADRSPQAPPALLYRGVALLLLDRPAEAAAALQAAQERSTPFWRPHAQWYLAVASERAGDAARAAALVRALCGGGSAYDQRACAGARALSGPRP